MTPGGQTPGADRLMAALCDFHCSVFRLETLQTYVDPVEAHSIAAFHRGAPVRPPDPVEDEWVAMLRVNRTAGRIQQRVHVVSEPITSYLAYELTWEYGPHAAAGEDIRIIPVTDHWPEDVPRSDFTLVDSRQRFDLIYDDAGNWLGAELVTDPAAVAAACFARDAALHQAVSWAEYVARYPELVRRLPKGA